MSATDRHRASDRNADDRVLPVTQWVALAIIPFLVVAAFLLFVFPTQSGELFAWSIAPPLSAYLLACAYVGGIWFFAGVFVASRWHRVRHGFPAVVVFAGALLIATLLHLDRFSHNLSFVVWMILYATTPLIIAALAIVQHRRDPGTPDPVDVVIPTAARVGLIIIGTAALAFGLFVFLNPQAAISFWAWPLTPLTAQVTGAVLSLTGVVNAGLLRDRRWSSFRLLFHAQLISLGAIGASLLLWHDDLLWDRPLTPAFVTLVLVALIAYAGFTAWCELQRHRQSRRG